jgi:F0F1-type ATP synthase membrane subunit a
MFGWNFLSGNILVSVLGVGSILVFLFLLCALELGVALLQAYVFTILLCTYIHDAEEMH